MSFFSNVASREHRAFEYFLSSTAPGLAGYFSREVYLTRVPKLSLSEVPLWHIVVALSSVHEGYAHSIQNSNRDAQLAQYAFGLKHYSLAVKSLTETISSQPGNLELVLLCCMLFVCFDCLRGNYTAASTHLTSGLNILCSEKDAGKLSPSYAKIIEQFTCLGLSVGIFIDIHLPETNTFSIWSQFSNLGSVRDNSTFKTLDDARHSLNMITINFMLHYTMSQKTDDLLGYKAILGPSTSTTRAALTAWTRNFDAMILLNDPANLSSSALRGSLQMKHHHASLLAIVNGISPVEGDDPNAPYRTIVTLARSLINVAPAPRASLSTDLGLVSSLFIAVSRCRVPALQREAFELLSAVPRREGLWDAEIAARIASEVLQVEKRDDERVAGERGLDMNLDELRVQKGEEHFGEMESELKVDLDFERTYRGTGRRERFIKISFI